MPVGVEFAFEDDDRVRCGMPVRAGGYARCVADDIVLLAGFGIREEQSQTDGAVVYGRRLGAWFLEYQRPHVNHKRLAVFHLLRSIVRCVGQPLPLQ